MKLLCVGFLLLFKQLTLAQNSKSWTCEEGDYHLSMQISRGLNSFHYGICEFSNYSSDKTAHFAVRVSSEKPNTYMITGPTSPEHLVLCYGSDDNLNQVQRIDDSYVIQTFTNCKLN